MVRQMSINLRGSGLRPRESGDHFDPRASIANLADAMLVLACGLMVSLIVYWNVDVSSGEQRVFEEGEVTEVADVERLVDQAASGGTAYTERGVVYEDPATGKLYMLEKDAESTSTAGESFESTQSAGSD
jgi:hypothetical protein